MTATAGPHPGEPNARPAAATDPVAAATDAVAAATNAVAAAWDRLSPIYQEYHDLPTTAVHYGPWAPLESELHLLGTMLGRRVLEIGCGGGQAAIALARQGATVSAIDLSAAQLAHARRLAAAEGVTVEFLLGDAASLSLPPSIAAFDLILSVNTFQYVAGMPECLHACHALLRAGGRLVFSLDHPLRTCFLDADAPGSDEELSIIPARSYFDRRPLRWRWGTTGIALQTYHRTVAEWCDFLAAAGFTLRRIVEPPPPPATLDEVYPPDDALAPLRLIPHTIIFVAEKS